MKQTPPKVGILIQNTISKFSKTTNQIQKRPPKVPKKLKTYIGRPQIKMLYKTDPTKSGNSDSKPKVELKKDPLKFQKIKNIYKDASNKKVL